MVDNRIDWNCRLLSRGSVDVSDLAEAMEVLSERCLISRFCMMLPFDASRESVAAFLLRRHRIEEQLRSMIPQKARFTVRTAAATLLSPKLYEERDLKKLCLSEGGYLPLLLPLGSFPEWADFELNRLLFQARMDKLLFLSFDRTSLFYTEETVDRLLRIPNAVFQVGYPTGMPSDLLLKMRKKRIKTVLGTEISSPSSVYRFCMDHDEKSATVSFPIADLFDSLAESCTFWND